MQKIKLAVLDNMMKQNLTSAEVNFMIHISHFQDAAGNIIGVYYKDICSAIAISYQTFYEVMRSLEKKGFISVQQDFIGDWNLKIQENDFTYPEADKEGYISTGHDIFHNKQFFALKANEKLLAMYILKVVGASNRSYNIGVKRFYTDFTRRFGVAKRSLQNYLSKLRQFFSIGIKGKNYWFTPLEKVYKDTAPTDRKLYAMHLVGTGCRRNKIKEYKKADFRDVEDLFKQYPSQLEDKIVNGGNLLLRAIGRSIEKGNKNKRILNPKFIHKLLGEEFRVNAV